MYTQTLSPKTKKIITLFTRKHPHFLSTFYLSGGTALSLQLGHRESEDLDFFCEHQFEPEKIEQELMVLGTLFHTELSKGTLNTFLNDVKLQFLEYPYQLIKPLKNWNGINLSSVEDIACTKLQTVAMRGSKKDFIDIFFLLKLFPISDLFSFTKKKYTKSDYNELHILKSLLYFHDAEKQPMPRMHKNVSWEEVKDTLIASVKQFQFK